MVRVYPVIVVTAMCLTSAVPFLHAQSCTGNGDFGGAYAFVGSRIDFAGVPAMPPGTSGAQSTGPTTGSTGTGSGTTPTTPAVSNTPVGQLIGGMLASSPFAAVGRILADGAGNLLASSTPTGALTSVGTYTVNQDCSISMTLNDVFIGMPVTPPGTASGGTAGGSNGNGAGNGGNSGSGGMSGSGGGNGTTATSTATPATITVEGIILDRGGEVDFAQTGASNTGAVITLRRALQFGGCTAALVSGPFGLVSQESVSSTASSGGGSGSGSLGVLSLVGRLDADGIGMFLANTQATQSPTTGIQLTGTYTVADDCSGTAQIVESTGATHNVNFVIVQARHNAATPGNAQAVLPELLFNFTDQGVTGTGYARHE